MKYYLATAVVAAVIGASITKYYYPTLQTVTETKEVVRNNVVTEIHEVTRTDGTKEVITVVIDKTVKKETASVVATAAPLKPKYHASVSVTRSADELLNNGATMVYGAQLDYNVLGPISVGIRADSSKQIGLTLGVAF